MTSDAVDREGAPFAPSGPGDLAYQKRLQESQWWKSDHLLEHQSEALGRLIAHAWRTVPFHRSRLEAAGVEPARPFDLTRWRRLPPLTRRDIQRAGDALDSTAAPAAYGRIVTTTTSGSTGTPITVRGTAFDAI